MTTQVCKCELSGYQGPRVACFRTAYLTFERIRNCGGIIDESLQLKVNSWIRISDIHIEPIKSENDLINLYEEFIHHTFIKDYSRNHPKFARECVLSNFNTRIDVLKQL